MKLKFRYFLSVITILLCVISLVGCGNGSAFASMKKQYKIDTDFLRDYEIVCDREGKTFTGTAPRFSVLQLQNEPTAFMQACVKKDGSTFSSEKNTELKEKIDAHKSCCLVIPQEYEPNWESDYKWIDSDGLYIVYFPNELRLMFYAEGH